MRSLEDFITITSGFRFSVHTGEIVVVLGDGVSGAHLQNDPVNRSTNVESNQQWIGRGFRPRPISVLPAKKR